MRLVGGGDILIDGPGKGAVVHDDVVRATRGDFEAVAVGRIGAIDQIAHPKPQAADDDVVGLDRKGAVFDGDAVAGGGLAGDGEKGMRDHDLVVQFDGAAGFEDHDARTFRFQGRTETTRSIRVEICDFDDLAAAATRCRRTIAFGAGKGRDLSKGRNHKPKYKTRQHNFSTK